jgi:hypothetical protein
MNRTEHIMPHVQGIMFLVALPAEDDNRIQNLRRCDLPLSFGRDHLRVSVLRGPDGDGTYRDADRGADQLRTEEMKSMTNPNDPAYPSHNKHHGLTKREYFAAMAMQGLLAQESEAWGFGDKEKLATEAVAQADALIAALNK